MAAAAQGKTGKTVARKTAGAKPSGAKKSAGRRRPPSKRGPAARAQPAGTSPRGDTEPTGGARRGSGARRPEQALIKALKAEHRHIASVMQLLVDQLNAIEHGEVVDTHEV